MRSVTFLRDAFASRSRGWALLSGCALFVSAFQCSSLGSIVIDDSFTGPDNTALLGRLAFPIDTPATTYVGNGNVSAVGGPTGGTPYEADIQSNAARIGSDAAVALSLGVATASQIQLSITFDISGDTDTQATDPHRGAGLGFFSSVAVGSGGSFHGFKNFTGLAVDRLGDIRLIVAGADSGVATTIAGFNPALTHTLSYVVDTTVGAGSIYNILLDGSSVSLLAPANTFTIARTALAGFYNSDGPITTLANFDDFTVAVVPESVSLLPLALVATAVSLQQWRERRRPRQSAS
jgi:hypothetical protein